VMLEQPGRRKTWAHARSSCTARGTSRRAVRVWGVGCEVWGVGCGVSVSVSEQIREAMAAKDEAIDKCKLLTLALARGAPHLTFSLRALMSGEGNFPSPHHTLPPRALSRARAHATGVCGAGAWHA